MGRMGLIEGGGGGGAGCWRLLDGIRYVLVLFFFCFFLILGLDTVVLWLIRLLEKMSALHSFCIPRTNMYIRKAGEKRSSGLGSYRSLEYKSQDKT